jgi:hypothetical protein
LNYLAGSQTHAGSVVDSIKVEQKSEVPTAPTVPTSDPRTNDIPK